MCRHARPDRDGESLSAPPRRQCVTLTLYVFMQ